jgi:DNA sulfur modification protein DndD
MFIKEIELNNFRIYKGKNTINILPDNDKNIVVISGKNGFGKTTFLMSLVWCLYGKQMEKVDELYRKEISNKGDYTKYISKSLNRLAESEGETKFSVSVTFTDVKIPDVTCREVKITRSYDTKTSASDKVEILIDGYPTELVEDLHTDNQRGEEIFIRDFILPIEVAKFFFFDAEKIVFLAKTSSQEERKLLSEAYAQVLGIKQYEDLKVVLNGILEDYHKKTATPKQKGEFNQLQAEIDNTEIEITKFHASIEGLKIEQDDKRYQSSLIQEKLIREGSQMTIEQLNDLKVEKEKLAEKVKTIQNELKDLYDLIPFALAGSTLSELQNQVLNEKIARENQYKQDNVKQKIEQIIDDLDDARQSFGSSVPTKVRDFYELKIKELIKKHFYPDIKSEVDSIALLINFSDLENNTLQNLISELKLSFKSKFTRISGDYHSAKNLFRQISNKVSDAEKNTEDEYITGLREQKNILDLRIRKIDNEINEFDRQIRDFNYSLNNLNTRKDNLRKILDASIKYNTKEKVAQISVQKLKDFINNFKEEKKKSFENGILDKLNILLHKKNFVKKVDVFISPSGSDIDINLYNQRNEKLDKAELSMGESQVYATALLKALIDESELQFPVFIDSPMQKFDADHAKNIILDFYPTVSKQVIIFPLIHKEMTESEYLLLKSKVSKSYLIENKNIDYSQFKEVSPDNLIKTYNQLYNNAN